MHIPRESSKGPTTSNYIVLISLATGLRIFDDKIRSTDARRAAALSYELDEIDIYSNSWGPGDLGFQVEGPENLTQKAMELAIKQV